MMWRRVSLLALTGLLSNLALMQREELPLG